jgi:hypothetical protein
MSIGYTIFEQLGGHRFVTMTGASGLVYLDNGLQFKIGRNATSCNRVTVTLNERDLYDVRFSRVSLRGAKAGDGFDMQFEDKEHALIKDVSVASLRLVFTDFTGLYTKL